MNIFDILGPVMVGPSSSHTAGAVRIGNLARRLLGEEPTQIEMLLHGSFAETGEGHGTNRALVAGLLEMRPDNEDIPNSFERAKEKGIVVREERVQLRDAHPNTVLLRLTDAGGRVMEVMGASLGGGRVRICQIDGMDTDFNGDYPTLIIHNEDKPGHVAQVTSLLSWEKINIANMRITRDSRDGFAVMVIETDQDVPASLLERLRGIPGLLRVTGVERNG